jgi:hypothetical protein
VPLTVAIHHQHQGSHMIHCNSLPFIVACALAGEALAVDFDAARDFGSDGKMAIRMRLDDGTPKPMGILVVSTGLNGDYRGVVAKPMWISAASLWHFALVGTSIKGGKYGDCSLGSGKALEDCIADIAKTSNHPELASVPIVTVGFSHGGAFSYSYAWWNPKRTIAFVNGKSGYSTDNSTPGFDKVPGLLVYSENDHPSVFPKMKSLMSAHARHEPVWCMLPDWGFKHEPGELERDAILFIDAIIRLNPKTGIVYGDGPERFSDPLVHVYAKPQSATKPEVLMSRMQSTFGITWQSLATGKPVGRIAAPQSFETTSSDKALDVRVEEIPADAAAVELFDNGVSIGAPVIRAGVAIRSTIKLSPGVHAIVARFTKEKQVVGFTRPVCVFAENRK